MQGRARRHRLQDAVAAVPVSEVEQNLLARFPKPATPFAPNAAAERSSLANFMKEEKAMFIVDAEGIVQDTGMTCRVAATRGPLAQRLRRLYRKKQLRRSPAPDFPVACAHPNGFVSWVLPTPPTTPVHMASTASLHPPWAYRIGGEIKLFPPPVYHGELEKWEDWSTVDFAIHPDMFGNRFLLMDDVEGSNVAITDDLCEAFNVCATESHPE
eukprot:s2030_g8.t1